MSFSKDTYWHISTALNPDKYGKTDCSHGYYFLDCQFFLVTVRVYDYQKYGYPSSSRNHGHHIFQHNGY